MFCCFLLPSCAPVILCLLCTLAQGLRPKLGPGSPSSMITVERNISTVKSFEAYNPSLTNINLSEASTKKLELEPEWHVLCSKPRRPFALPLVKEDCQHLSDDIRKSDGAHTFRVYRQAEGPSKWSYGGCHVSVAGIREGVTDVFKPNLIAREIMRVAQLCAPIGLGGVTNVGPRRYFIITVSNFRIGMNSTVATE